MYTDILQLESELDVFLLDFGFQAVDFQCARSNRTRIYRLFIDRIGDEPVTIDDCSTIARQVVLYLETKSLYDDNCRMEVSSAGLDRILKRDRDFERFLGKKVKAAFYLGDRRKTITGELVSFNDDALVLTSDEKQPKSKSKADVDSDKQPSGETMTISRDSLVKVNLVPNLEF